MSVTVKINGLKELSSHLQQLGRKTSNRISVKAMRRGATVVREQARSNAPELAVPTPTRRRGTLKKAISSRTKVKGQGKTESYVWVKTLSDKQVSKFKSKTGKKWADNPKDPFYWRFVEFGTSKMPARSFMRSAFEQSKEKAATTIIDTLRKEILTEGNK